MEPLVPKELLDSVVAFYNPRKVILFGSHARGEAGPDSDIDLFVVLDDDVPAEKLGWRAGYEARRGFHGATDIVRCRASAFDHRRRMPGSLSYTVSAEGKVVYERTG